MPGRLRRKNDSVEDLCKVFLKLLISDARNGTAVVPDVLSHLDRIQANLCIDKCKAYDQQGVDN